MTLTGSRKPYVRPELESYGDIRKITAGNVKDFGLTDGFILVTNQNLKNFS
ncbi:MAG: hypothetical protein ACYDEB_04840 [Dehalococcoidia bacterium]